jgi:hypothetical protein
MYVERKGAKAKVTQISSRFRKQKKRKEKRDNIEAIKPGTGEIVY